MRAEVDLAMSVRVVYSARPHLNNNTTSDQSVQSQTDGRIDIPLS